MYVYITTINTIFIVSGSVAYFADINWSLTVQNLFTPKKISVYIYYIAGFSRAYISFKEPFVYQQFLAEYQIFKLRLSCNRKTKKKIKKIEKP